MADIEKNLPPNRLDEFIKGRPITAEQLNQSVRAVNRFVSGARLPQQSPNRAIPSVGIGSTVVVARVATASISSGGIPSGTSVSVDGSNATLNALVLLAAQSTAANRGVWKVNTGAWTQHTTYTPTVCIVTAGTANTNTLWYLSAATPVYSAIIGMYA